MNRRALVVATAVLAVSVFGIGAATYRPTTTTQAGLIRPHSPIIGPANAPVTIVEFFDPGCETCRAVYPAVKQIMARYPKDVRLVLRYVPFHKGSDEAIKIIEAARLQDKFVPVLEALLFAQPRWADHGKPDVAIAWGAAGSTGLDLERARKDAAQPKFDTLLQQEIADIKAFDVKATPAFYVNGRPLVQLSLRGLLALVEEEVTASRKGAGG